MICVREENPLLESLKAEVACTVEGSDSMQYKSDTRNTGGLTASVETGQDILVFLKKGHKWFEDEQGWGLIIEQKKHQEHV